MTKKTAAAIILAMSVGGMQGEVMRSPGGNIEAVPTGRNSLSVRHDGKEVMTIATLGLKVNGKDRKADTRKTGEVRDVNDTYAMLAGKKKHCTATGAEYTMPLDKGGVMELRLYDDGVAVRYVFADLDNVRIDGDLTAYAIPETANRWLQTYNSVYEDFYPLQEGAASQGEWGYPSLFQTGDDEYILLTEANIHRDNSASRLSNQEEATVYKVTLGESDMSIDGAWTSPWRAAIIGSLADVVESTMVTSLSDPAAIDDTEWIEPGVVSWIYWAYNHGSNDYEIVKRYVDMARTLRLPYVLIDAEWDEMGNGGDIADAVAYAKAQGVKPLIWYNSSTAWTKEWGAPGPHERLNDPQQREKEFADIAAMGVAGVKIDFFAGDTQPTMQYCIDLLESAARHHLLVNFHGATIPRGWQRTYPHLMSVEAVYGAEWYNNLPVLTERAASHNATLPFTRNVIGPMDYTPCTFSDSQHPHITTKGHELALTVLYESALQHLADKPESYLSQPLVVQDFLTHLPSTWDDTRLLGGYPGEWAAIARKKGDKWYVGIINGKDSDATYRIDWSRILPPGQAWQTTTYGDHAETADAWHIVSTYGQLPSDISLKARGGQTIIIDTADR